MKKFLATIMAMVVIFGFATTAVAGAYPFRTILLVDRTGTVEEQEAVEYRLYTIKQDEFDRVQDFDCNLSEAIDTAIKDGYTKIAVITYNRQEEYNFDVYTDVNIIMLLVEAKDENMTNFLLALKDSLSNSRLTVESVEGREVYVDEFESPIIKVEVKFPEPNKTEELIPEVESKTETKTEEIVYSEEENNNLWWVGVLLILAATGSIVAYNKFIRK